MKVKWVNWFNHWGCCTFNLIKNTKNQSKFLRRSNGQKMRFKIKLLEREVDVVWEIEMKEKKERNNRSPRRYRCFIFDTLDTVRKILIRWLGPHVERSQKKNSDWLGVLFKVNLGLITISLGDLLMCSRIILSRSF